MPGIVGAVTNVDNGDSLNGRLRIGGKCNIESGPRRYLRQVYPASLFTNTAFSFSFLYASFLSPAIRFEAQIWWTLFRYGEWMDSVLMELPNDTPAALH
jgi:hypothetical protein